MSYSALVSYVGSCDKKNFRQNADYNASGKVQKITIHHCAGILSCEQLQSICNGSREVSYNYGIGSDGRVGLYVPEEYRAWTSSSRANDYLAVTIEVSNCSGSPNWEVSDTCYNKLIDLVVDICERNGITKLNWTGNSSGNLTTHDMFTATACPGPYLKGKMPDMAQKVNERLSGAEPEPKPVQKFKIGQDVIINGSLYESSTATVARGSVKNKKTKITRYAAGAPHPYNTTGDTGWMNESDITAYTVTHTTLRKGDRGSEVKEMQVKLLAKGYSVGLFGADGIYGTATYNAVFRFQKAEFPNSSAEWDGICGPKTWAKLDA